MPKPKPVVLEVAGREVAVTNPDRIVFPEPGHTKLDLIRYYLAVADGALRGVAGRPMVLKRFVKGLDEEAIFQKRAPANRPGWIEVAELHYRSGTSAAETVVRDAAGLAWVVNLGCIDLNPHPVLAEDLDHPDELRIDLDPMPGVEWGQIIDVAQIAREVLVEHGLTPWPKTSGSKGFHIYARVCGTPSYPELRRAAQTVAREVANRAPEIATARWWKEERGSTVFVDFNQNAKDRTVASAYSIRARPDARVSAPLTWDEVPSCRPETFTLTTVLERFAAIGDPWAGMDEAPGTVDALLSLAKELGPAEKPPKGEGRRQFQMPLIEIARSKTRPESMAALEQWKQAHVDVVPFLQEPDVLVDGMRGSSSIWYRIRINLQHVPEGQRPPQEPLIIDYDPWGNVTDEDRARWQARRGDAG